MIDNNKKQTKPEFILISACTGSDHDWLNNEMLENDLIRLGEPYKQVRGYYQDIDELSYYVELTKTESAHKLLELARKYKQHSILHVFKNRCSVLIETKGYKMTQLGTFKQVPKDFALQHKAYTHDPVNGGYYITTKTPIKR